MAKSQLYNISLSSSLFVDPTFSKKYSTYLPLKRSFLNNRLVDIMSPTCFKLVVILLDHAHNVRSSCFDLADNMLPSCREPVSNALFKLYEYQILTKPPFLKNELKNELIKRNNKHRTLRPVKTEAAETKELSTQPAKAVDVVEIKISSEKSIAVKRDLVSSWAETYPKDFLDLSLKEMRSWVLSNPEKAPKSAWPRFINGWFKRGWERYRTTIKSNPIKISVEDLNEVLGGL